VVENLDASITLSRNVLVLALDTTSRAGSVAVVRDGALAGEAIGDPAVTHGARLPLDLVRALEAAAVDASAIDLLAVAAGPGSFTGLRVGIATMQGLAMATGKHIVPISVLDALARAGAGDRAPVAAWMDAQRGEIFAALYDAGGSRLLIEPTALSPAETIERWREMIGDAPLFIGDGAVRYAPLLRREFGEAVAIVEPPPLAPIVGRLACEHPERGVAPHAVVPIYIRRSDAEIARDRMRPANEEARDAG
jgi:tRNA threonylcarbamoyladenosine biosynthesis protein TsaB